ncbi:MAG: enoyl-CoA hydratase/isomerase family protein [Desulfobacterales bacterium]|nr:enoyl-CoA hydratase/isomerase family protein [Deltaproteobacteria bacterium]NNK85438.1 enoyl-CoA hydratase/isomerase family protein [Desulfobacterales bacterium]NNL42535.1 enoyl-CoA hydratase/isomerase family protein [Desulfobacterales bacterium]
MSQVEYTLDENVAVVTLNNDENRFNPDFLTACLDVLDEVENKTNAVTLVVKSSHEKIFSNGIDLEWLVPVIQQGDLNTAKNYFFQLNALFKRVVTYPMITIAAITGHAFAGGAILCCAFDFRFMRSDRGYFCFPEVDLGIPFLPGMNAMLKKAIPTYKLEEMEYTGKRLTADECEEHHIITKACHINELMDETLAFAKTLNKKRAVIQEMKQRLNKDIIHALDVEDVSYIESGKFNI